jgi:hypothetical protein
MGVYACAKVSRPGEHQLLARDYTLPVRENCVGLKYIEYLDGAEWYRYRYLYLRGGRGGRGEGGEGEGRELKGTISQQGAWATRQRFVA